MKLTDFILCDDIRQERGDKLSLMGVFTDNITLQVPTHTPRPFGFKLMAFFRVLIEAADQTMPDQFRVSVKGSANENVTIEGGINITGRIRMLQLPLPLVPLAVQGDTTLSFEIQLLAKGNEIFRAAPPYTVSVRVTEIDRVHLMETEGESR